MAKKIKACYFFCKSKKNNILKYTVFPLIIFVLGSFLLANTAFLSSITEEKIIELTNMERKKQNLPALTANQMLAKAAYEKGQDIFATQTFQHNINNNKFSVWIKNANYEYDYVGENLAIDFMTAEGALKAWLESATHKKNILNERFNEIGVAVINGNFEGEDTILIVQIFGTPKILNSALSKNKIKTTEPTVQNEYINTNPLSELTLVNANNGSKALAPATPGAEFDHLNNNINNLLIHFSQLKASAIKSLNNFKLKILLNYLILLLILSSTLRITYSSNLKIFDKIKTVLKKQKTQLQLPLK